MSTAAGGSVHVYRYQTSPARSDADIIRCASEAMEKCVVKGIRGPSIFMFLGQYSFTKSTAIDCIHVCREITFDIIVLSYPQA